MKRFPVILLMIINIITALNGYSQKGSISHKPMAGREPDPLFMNITELNYGIGLGVTSQDYAKQYFSVSDIFGIGIAKNFAAGIGLGASFYNGGALFPFFADLRYYFDISKIKLFIFGDGGVLLNSGDTPGGRKFLLSPGAGVALNISDNLSLNLGAGLFTQLMKDKAHDSFAVLKAGVAYSFGQRK